MVSKVLFSDKNGILDKPELRNLSLFYGINMFLLITDILMPQYFGIHIGWDITCTRFANILLFAYALLFMRIMNGYTNVFIKCSTTVPFLLYLLVALYTMVFRADINAFMLPFFEVLTFYMLIFSIRYVIGCRTAIKIINRCAYFLGVYGFVEFLAGHSLYLQFLRTVPTLVRNCYRSGYYRIMGPCGHPLGYGLLLILLVGVACIDEDTDEVYLLKRPLLVFLLVGNVFLTGSRSSQGFVALEIVLIIILSNRKNRTKTFLALLCLLFGLCIFLLIFGNSKIGHYIMMQITTLVDQVFDTSFAAKYGVDVTTLNNSEEYRKFLPKVFELDWLNPLVGRGIKRSFGAEIPLEDGTKIYLHSIDNFYVCQYIKYAYPGMISYILVILVVGISMLYSAIRYKSGTIKLLLVAFACYFINLWYLDALQTQKFIYIIVALFYAVIFSFSDEKLYS